MDFRTKFKRLSIWATFGVAIASGPSTPCYALAEIGSDFILSGLNFNNYTYRTRNFLMLGGEALAIGPVGYYERTDRYVTDMIAGMGLRVGRSFHIALDAGYYKRIYQGADGVGFAGALIPGWNMTSNFRISIPFVVKRITHGSLPKRWTLQYLPFLGLRIMI